MNRLILIKPKDCIEFYLCGVSSYNDKKPVFFINKNWYSLSELEGCETKLKKCIYHVFDFFNDHYSTLSISRIEKLIEGGNPLYITETKEGLITFLKKLGKELK